MGETGTSRDEPRSAAPVMRMILYSVTLPSSERFDGFSIPHFYFYGASEDDRLLILSGMILKLPAPREGDDIEPPLQNEISFQIMTAI